MQVGKKIGTYTARGQISEEFVKVGMPKRIRLFDGRFDTAYVVREFHYWATGSRAAYSYEQEGLGKLATNDQASFDAVNFCDASNSNEIAWASTGAPANQSVSDILENASIIDPENLIIEDLWVYAITNPDTAPANYLIVMDKYEISESIGAVAMSRDRASESGYVD